jgi:hypothetical protein
MLIQLDGLVCRIVYRDIYGNTGILTIFIAYSLTLITGPLGTDSLYIIA